MVECELGHVGTTRSGNADAIARIGDGDTSVSQQDDEFVSLLGLYKNRALGSVDDLVNGGGGEESASADHHKVVREQ